MPNIVYNFSKILFAVVIMLSLVGASGSVLHWLQGKAYHSVRHGLVNMRSINEQLVGKTKD